MSKTPEPITFDREYYLGSNPDLSDDIDLEEHYGVYGWREGRDPSPYFDSSFYARKNAGHDLHFNPLRHYNDVGRFNNLAPRPKNSKVLSELHPFEGRPKVAIHCRITDLSLWPEICDILAHTAEDCSIILSVDHSTDFDGALRYSEQYDGLNDRISCVVVPPETLDFEVLLVQLRDRVEQFDVWANIYTMWEAAPEARAYRLSQTIGSRDLVARYIGQLTTVMPSGLCFCETGRAVRSENKTSVERWTSSDLDISYPSDSVFWVRSDVLKDVANVWSGNVAQGRTKADGRKTWTKAICDAATAKGYGFCAVRAEAILPDLLKGPARSARAELDQRGDRWRAFSSSITDNRPLTLPDNLGPINSERIDLHWVVPDFAKGGGGHMTIFRFVHLLEAAKFRQTIWIQNVVNHSTPAIARERIKSWYQPISDSVIVRFLPDDVEAISGDAVIATDCWTAFPVSRMTHFKERFYFIQDWETEFHPAGDLRLAASLTYQFGFTALTAGRWLARKAEEAGMDVICWTLGADRTNYRPKATSQVSAAVFTPLGVGNSRDLYRARKVINTKSPNREMHTEEFEYRKNGHLIQLENVDARIPQIALYARGFTPRRAVDLAIAGLKSLAKRGWLFHVHLYGEEKDFGDLPFIYTPHGLVDPQSLGRIYAKCDLGIAFSATNYSLVPLEMMAGDVPVVEIDTESTRAAYPPDTVVRAAPAAYAIADELEALLRDPTRRQALIAAGRKFAEVSDWDASAAAVAGAISSRVIAKSDIDVSGVIQELKAQSGSPVLSSPATVSTPSVSIFIPTYNAGPDFDVVLQAIAEQTFEGSFELVVIDSGSTDETLEIIKRWSHRIRTNVISISNEEFGHGRTRNQGIDASEGEYVAILTQDACPASPWWLQNLIKGFGAGDRVAGVFGRHLAYPIHDLFEGPGLRSFFEKFRLLGSVYSIDDHLPGYVCRGTPNWQSALQFYSDNNSCMRKSVWKILPYPDVAWGEDQVWAWEVVRLGFQKAYAHDAPVYHSHDYSSKKLMQVGNEEGHMFLQHFGMHVGIDGDRPDGMDAIVNIVRESVASDAKILAERGVSSDALLLRRALQHLALQVGRSDGIGKTKRVLRE